ncbi:putative regulator of Ras-like GTPase activity (Roadblock/LC7/MglB family) [Catenulispora sp. GAS73]|uniref:roadblock/LC7 domain-containing protein n=1 Tax=Catenulispora sp. GAS73 TaxID=3156269 RepID=UPI0035175443
MTTTEPATNDLSWLLDRIVQRLPDARAAVLTSTDGIRAHHTGVDIDDADRLAALAVSLFALARGIDSSAAHSTDVVRQVIVERDDALLFVASAAPRTVVALLTSPSADPGLVGHEMAQAIAAVSKHLATPSRSPDDELER